jgi:hypothetical protein
VANGAAADTMLAAAPIARRTFLIAASYTDRRAGRFPTVPRIVRKSGDFSELRHSEIMIFATCNV